MFYSTGRKGHSKRRGPFFLAPLYPAQTLRTRKKMKLFSQECLTNENFVLSFGHERNKHTHKPPTQCKKQAPKAVTLRGTLPPDSGQINSRT